MTLQLERSVVDVQLLTTEKLKARRAAQAQKSVVMSLESALQEEKRKHEEELEKLQKQLQQENEKHAMELRSLRSTIQKQEADIEKGKEELEALKNLNQDHATQKDLQLELESLQATHRLELKAAKEEAYQLALQQLQNKALMEEHQTEKLVGEQLSLLKDPIDRFQQSQETYVGLHNAERREWNELIDILTQKQRQVFDVTLPNLDTRIKEFEKQINELKQVELSAGTTATSPPIANPSAGVDDDSGGETRNNRHPFDRRPPLTKVDSLMNRHVTEFYFVADEQKGKYTGFLNAMNMPNGFGLLHVDNDDVYVGEWKNGQRHGQGVFNWCDGNLYTGPWFEGERHGHGVFVFADGGFYDGQHNMGRREGQGMFIWSHGAKYEGSFHDDKREGFGEYTYPDGRIYRGGYKDNCQHGYGVETSKDGRIIHDGQWAFGEFCGDGDCASVAVSISDPRY